MDSLSPVRNCSFLFSLISFHDIAEEETLRCLEAMKHGIV